MSVPAILGTMRLGNARLGYATSALTSLRATRIRVLIAGALANARVRRAGLSIKDVINETPSTCSLTVDTTAPSVAESLQITINSDTPRLLFAGALQQVSTTYEAGKPANLAYPCSATDDLERLKRRLPFGTWSSVSATTIAQEIIEDFAPDFTADGVEADLPTVSVNLDGSEGFDGALKQLAGLIGGYYYVEDGVVHLFQSEATDTPDPLDVDHPPLNSPPLTIDTDLSQLRTRVYGKGYGSTTPTDVAVGETILPVDSSDPYNAAGGRVIAETQRLAYTGVQTAGGGSLVGPGASPSVAPMAALAVGAGITAGTHQWAYTFITASGESLPSPVRTLLVGSPTTPASAPSVSAATGSGFRNGDLVPGDSLSYAYSYSTATSAGDVTQDTAMSPTASATAAADPFVSTLAQAPIITVAGSSDPRVRFIHVWRSVNGGSFQLINHTSTEAITNSGAQNYQTADIGHYSGSHSAATLNRVTLTGIAVGPTGTTSRKIYRSLANVASLHGPVTTLADNTTTTYTDLLSDTFLTAFAPPSSDTSGLTTEDGTVLAGATTIPTASAAPFSTTGGWAQVGSSVVRYTGVSGNDLTGVPAEGDGALVSSVRYGEPIDSIPALTGVTGIETAIPSGTQISIFVQRDDLAAQASMAALDGGDGIYEYLVSDERRNETSLTALCDANLQLYAYPIVTARYATRDVKTKSGKPITITDLLGYTGTLTIQDVAISEIDIAPSTAPRFTVTASSVRVSLESVLQNLMGKVTA